MRNDDSLATILLATRIARVAPSSPLATRLWRCSIRIPNGPFVDHTGRADMVTPLPQVNREPQYD